MAGALDAGEQVAGGVEHLGAERGELDRPGTTGAVEQLAPDHPLEGRDLLADRRLRIAQFLRRAAEGALRRDGVEGDEMADFEVPERRHVHKPKRSC